MFTETSISSGTEQMSRTVWSLIPHRQTQNSPYIPSQGEQTQEISDIT